MMKSIKIEVIPHNEQRYDTCGDWIIGEDGNHIIKVSDTGCEQSNWLVAVHELVEMLLCIDRKISQSSVDMFDKDWATRDTKGEPGDSPASPYMNEHFSATNIERLLSKELRISWPIHESNVGKL